MRRFDAGFAHLPFIIPMGTPMAGFAARTSGCTDQADALSARALALGDGAETTVLVVADLTSLAPERARHLRERIAERTGLPVSAVMVSVTHTHAAPNVDSRLVAPVAADEVIRQIEDTIVAAGSMAWERRVPAIVHAFESRVDGVARNRRDPRGPLDPGLTVLRVDDASGATIGVLFSFACHPTVLGPDNYALSAEWPGRARDLIEARFAGATSVFVQGSCGDCNVGHAATASLATGSGPGRDQAGVDRVGQAVAEQVLAVVDGSAPLEPRVRHVEHRHSWIWDPQEARPASAPPTSDLLRNLQKQWEWRLAARSGTVVEPIDITVLDWGRVTVVGMPGEPFAALSHDLRHLLPDRIVVAAGYTNGVPGYAPHPEVEYTNGGYEVEIAHQYYGRPGPMPAWYSQAVLDAVRGGQ